MSNDDAWITTLNGRVFRFLEPKLEDIDIHVIAHALARECRWGNHLQEHYSVAEHSVRVSFVCDSKDALWGLLHDASEAWLTDIPTPIKRYIRHGIDEFIGRLQEVLHYGHDDLPRERRDQIMRDIRAACPDLLGYDDIERRLMRAVCNKFGLDERMPESVVHADAVLLVTEKRDLVTPVPVPWGPTGIIPLTKRITPWSETVARSRFLKRFYELRGLQLERQQWRKGNDE